jgi:hypothetical protein
MDENRRKFVRLMVTGGPVAAASTEEALLKEFGGAVDAAKTVDAGFIARAAVVFRERGKLTRSAFLLALLEGKGEHIRMEQTFPAVCNNPVSLKRFVQIIRCGVVGRRAFSNSARRLVRNWITEKSGEELFQLRKGDGVSLVDLLRIFHPRPRTAAQRALFAYLTGKPYNRADLPECALWHGAQNAHGVLVRSEDAVLEEELLNQMQT